MEDGEYQNVHVAKRLSVAFLNAPNPLLKACSSSQEADAPPSLVPPESAAEAPRARVAADETPSMSVQSLLQAVSRCGASRTQDRTAEDAEPASARDAGGCDRCHSSTPARSPLPFSALLCCSDFKRSSSALRSHVHGPCSDLDAVRMSLKSDATEPCDCRNDVQIAKVCDFEKAELHPARKKGFTRSCKTGT